MGSESASPMSKCKHLLEILTRFIEAKITAGTSESVWQRTKIDLHSTSSSWNVKGCCHTDSSSIPLSPPRWHWVEGIEPAGFPVEHVKQLSFCRKYQRKPCWFHLPLIFSSTPAQVKIKSKTTMWAGVVMGSSQSAWPNSPPRKSNYIHFL